ncbi:MAG: SDR family oxidoreductase [Chloroflexota bacterium]|nr:SDR family oxidoreductase [Chloroflexota bacterium]
MGDRLKDKVAVITGAGRGIGKGIALLMAEEGAKVVVNDFGGTSDGTGDSTSPADEVVAEIKSNGGTAVANYDSVATTEGGNNIIKTAIDHFGRLDILVNNAGILRDRMIFNMTPEEWHAVIQVHLYGHFNCTQPASVIMRQQRSGRIINFSSSSGLGNMGQVNYSAGKEGIIGFTRTVARDLGRYGVTCNAIRPGAATRLTLTPELRAAWKKRAAEGGKPLPELTEWSPDDIAPFVVWIASDAAANVNGYDFSVKAGHIGLYSQPTELRAIAKAGGQERWTFEELEDLAPKELVAELENPSPPKDAS